MKLRPRKGHRFLLLSSACHPVRTCLLILLIICTTSTPLFAEVYKWIDENGKTHYSDKPRDGKAETILIKETPQLDANHSSRVEKQQRLLKVLDEERQEAEQIKAEERTERLKRETNCARARQVSQNIKNARFLYKKSDDPRNPTVYSDEERAKIAEEAKKVVQQWCK